MIIHFRLNLETQGSAYISRVEHSMCVFACANVRVRVCVFKKYTWFTFFLAETNYSSRKCITGFLKIFKHKRIEY